MPFPTHSCLFPSSFYRKPLVANFAKFGPFMPAPLFGGVGNNLVRPLFFPQKGSLVGGFPVSTVRQSIVFESMHRTNRFPGVAQMERPAVGQIQFPAKAGITDLSTLGYSDGGVTFVWLFHTAPFVPGGSIDVDIQAAVTPADVAAAWLAATNAWLLANPQPAPGGIIAAVTGSVAFMVQSNRPKTLQSAVPGENAFNLSWIAKTNGGYGNNPIFASIPGEWSGAPGAGTLIGMDGGKWRRPGVLGMVSSSKRAQFIPFFGPPLNNPEG